jgi:hypothetical protein
LRLLVLRIVGRNPFLRPRNSNISFGSVFAPQSSTIAFVGLIYFEDVLVDIRAFSSRMRFLEFGSMEFMMSLTALTSVFSGYWYFTQGVG